jgi:hypothetical protein
LIELPRALARQFRAVLRRSLMADAPRGPWPLVLCRAGEGGLTLHARSEDLAVRYHQPGRRPPDAIAFRASLLAEFEGRADTPVTLEQVASGKGRAGWGEGGVPRSLEFDTVTPDSVPPLPGRPKRLAPMPDDFLAALAEAARTAGREPARLAVSRVQLRGKAGEVVATDGRQLLIQAGFPLPWPDDVLVPRVPAFGLRELGAATPVRLGRGEGHVAVLAGPWALLLAVDTTSRYPHVDTVIPSPRATKSTLHIHPEDGAFLVSALPRLPGAGDHLSPVTLDLGRAACVRARAEGGGRATEVALARSEASGAPLRLCMDRCYLRRAAQLGFSELQIERPDAPVVCRDAKRTYLWMPLDQGSAVPPTDDALRISSADPQKARAPAPPSPQPDNPRRRRPMPAPQNNGHAPRPGGPGGPPATPPGPAAPAGVVALVEEAEAVRALLREAHGRLGRLVAALKEQRKQARAVQAAVASLRQLQQLGR